jgi:hypothetical protein
MLNYQSYLGEPARFARRRAIRYITFGALRLRWFRFYPSRGRTRASLRCASALLQAY